MQSLCAVGADERRYGDARSPSFRDPNASNRTTSRVYKASLRQTSKVWLLLSLWADIQDAFRFPLRNL